MGERPVATGRGAMRALLAAGAALLAAAAAVADASPEGARVAVLPIVVHSIENHEYLREGLADMLASRLAQRPGLDVVRVEDPKAATTDLQAARSAGEAVGADYVLFGSFTRFGDGASIDLYCARTREGDAARRIFVQSGTLGEIIPRLDELAQKVGIFVVAGGPGEAPAVSAAPPGGRPAAPVAELEARIEALERAVFGREQELGAAPGDFDAADPGSR